MHNDLRQIHQELEQLLSQHPGGWRDEKTLNKVSGLVNRLKGPGNPYLSEKAGSLYIWTEILFSPRKHEKWGGARKVKDFVHADLAKIDMAIDSMQKFSESSQT